MKKITKSEALAVCIDEKDNTSRRKCFSENSGIQLKKQKGKTPSFCIFFMETAGYLFQTDTKLKLYEGKDTKGNIINYYCYLNSEKQIKIVENWEKQQGDMVFLRDLLPLSVALSYNINMNKNAKTKLGELEERAKINKDQEAISGLVELASHEISRLVVFSKADFICAVPALKEKVFDLPRILASEISKKINKPDITQGFIFGSKKDSIKKSKLKDKWEGWEKAEMIYNGIDIKGKKIILIDDKYQSGITMQFIAMKLQEAGAGKVYGMCMVKTMRNSDNEAQ